MARKNAIGALISKRDISKVIGENLVQIEKIFYLRWPSRDFSELESEVMTRIENGSLSDRDLNEGWAPYPFVEMDGAHKNSLVLSLAYSKLAAIAVVEGNSDIAWSLIAHACWSCGISEGYLTKADPNESQLQSARGSLGGAARASKTLPIREEAARLLSCKKPKGGWKKKCEAAAGILDDLDFFLAQKKDKPLNPEALTDRLTNWLSSDNIVKSAFEENAASKEKWRKREY